MKLAIKRAIALAFVTFLVVVSTSVIFTDDGEADSGKYLLNVEITKSFNDLDGGTITVTFQEYADGEHTLNVKVKSANRQNLICEKDVVVPQKTGDGKYKESFSFKIGNGEMVYITAYENGKDVGDELTITINVEKTIWTNPLVWVVVVIVIIALVVFGIMRYRHVVDKKKDKSKEKIFTKMEEERKQKKLNK